MATKVDLTLKRGDTGRWDLACTNKLGLPLDLTGAVLRFYGKLDPGDADGAAVLRKDSAGFGGIVVTDAGNGLARITVAPADTAALVYTTRLVYDVQVTEADGSVTTLVEGGLTVSVDITRQT